MRLAWHDSGTYDKRVSAWPACGGANGSIRFEVELGHGANAGLVKGITTYLMPIHTRHPAVSWADLIQLGSATAVAHAGGPRIAMRYGRVDVPTAAQCPPEGRLPDAMPPFGDGAPDAASHLRAVFYRMGFNDAEIVALSGAHTLGRAFKERSGTVSYGCVCVRVRGKGGSAQTDLAHAASLTCGLRALLGAASAPPMAPSSRTRTPSRAPTASTAWAWCAPFCGSSIAAAHRIASLTRVHPPSAQPGGQSWTARWLRFDNSYFTPPDDPALLRLPTDEVLATDPSFWPHFLRYGASQAAFFADYAAAHAKLSELGSAFMPAGGITID